MSSRSGTEKIASLAKVLDLVGRLGLFDVGDSVRIRLRSPDGLGLGLGGVGGTGSCHVPRAYYA